MTSGTVPERHRELVPVAGLTGNARSATDAQCRSRGPWRRTKMRKRTADRGQCVSARGRNSNAGPAGLASFAAWNRRERWGMATAVAAKCERRQARCSRRRWSGHRLWHRRSGRTMPKAHPRFLASRAKEGTGAMVKPWAAPLSTTKHQGRQASGTTGAQGATVKITTPRACVCRARCTPGRQLDRADAIPVWRRKRALAIPKIAD